MKAAREKNYEIRTKKQPASSDLFSAVAEEWYERNIENVRADSYARTIKLRLVRYILPALGNTAISDINPMIVLQLCRIIEDSGIPETARRIKLIIGQIMRYAAITGRCDNDPTTVIKGALRPKRVKHLSTLTEKEDVVRFVLAIDSYKNPMMRLALFIVLPKVRTVSGKN